MKLLLLNIVLALAWMALTGHFAFPNFVVGFVFGYLILYVVSPPRRRNYFFKVRKTLGLGSFFIMELIKANIRVALEVLSPRHSIRPGVVAIPLDVDTPVGITLLANLITLTPGTLSLDVSNDRKVLYVHSMYIENADAFRKEIKDGFERRILEVLQ